MGLACALSCKILGAAKIIVGDVNKERLKLAKVNGYDTVDLTFLSNEQDLKRSQMIKEMEEKNRRILCGAPIAEELLKRKKNPVSNQVKLSNQRQRKL